MLHRAGASAVASPSHRTTADGVGSTMIAMPYSVRIRLVISGKPQVVPGSAGGIEPIRHGAEALSRAAEPPKDTLDSAERRGLIEKRRPSCCLQQPGTAASRVLRHTAASLLAELGEPEANRKRGDGPSEYRDDAAIYASAAGA